jgi:arylformamidase
MIYDISMPITKDVQVYKNKPDKRPTIETVADHTTHSVHETSLSFNLHTGTHIDYPLHMIEGGATSDTERLETLLGEAKVFDLRDVQGGIEQSDLATFDIQNGDFVLLRTTNSDTDQFRFDFVYLAESGARYLADHGVRGVGIDALGIERDQAGHPTHKILLSRGILILEGLRLQDVSEGTYSFVCLPLSIPGVEAAPVRAILMDL